MVISVDFKKKSHWVEIFQKGTLFLKKSSFFFQNCWLIAQQGAHTLRDNVQLEQENARLPPLFTENGGRPLDFIDEIWGNWWKQIFYRKNWQKPKLMIFKVNENWGISVSSNCHNCT